MVSFVTSGKTLELRERNGITEIHFEIFPPKVFFLFCFSKKGRLKDHTAFCGDLTTLTRSGTSSSFLFLFVVSKIL